MTDSYSSTTQQQQHYCCTMLFYTKYVRSVLVLESGAELEWGKTKPGTAGCCCCCSWSCAPDGVLGSRLPTCISCHGAAIAQQKAHQQDGARNLNSAHLRLWARSGGGAVQLLVVCSIAAPCLLVLFLFGISKKQFKPEDTKPHVFLKTPHHTLPNVTAGDPGVFLGTLFFWRRQIQKLPFARNNSL